MQSTNRTFFFLTLLISLTISDAAFCQSRIPEKYITKEKPSLNPLTFSLLVGWGQLVGGPEMLPVFQNTQETILGGPYFSVQALFPVPWIWDRLTLGIDGWYHRVGKRFLGDVDSKIVYYTATREPVTLIESVSGFGVMGVADIVIDPSFHLQLGGGGIYLKPHEQELLMEATGLFPETFEPNAMLGIVYSLARYDGGSVDIDLRMLRQFGKYNNLIFQGAMGFSFRL